jgi:hypothetical protein
MRRLYEHENNKHYNNIIWYNIFNIPIYKTKNRQTARKFYVFNNGKNIFTYTLFKSHSGGFKMIYLITLLITKRSKPCPYLLNPTNLHPYPMK